MKATMQQQQQTNKNPCPLERNESEPAFGILLASQKHIATPLIPGQIIDVDDQRSARVYKRL